jgi:two-component system sensor histidine kinase KdpD
VDSENFKKSKSRNRFPKFSFTSGFGQYAFISAIIVSSLIAAYLTKAYISYEVVAFLLLFLVSLLALFFSTGPVLLAATMSAVIWNYVLVPKHFSMHIDKPEDVLMVVMFYIIVLLNGTLTSRIRRQEEKIRIREERTHALYQLTRDMTLASDIEHSLKIAVEFIERHFGFEFSILLTTEKNHLETGPRHESSIHLSEQELKIAVWVFTQSSRAGKNTDTFPESPFMFFPLAGISTNVGVIVVKADVQFTQGEEQFWESFISYISGKFEREHLRNAARNMYLLRESDKLYKTLFNSISHELRIPVSTILGASDTLITHEYPPRTKQNLYTEINTAALRLNRLIENLLNMSRLESGRITPRPDWCDINDLVFKVSEQLKEELAPFEWVVQIQSDLALINVDFGLLEQILYNLVLNATQNSPKGSKITLDFRYGEDLLTFTVTDEGKGFPSAELPSVFNKFYRGKNAKVGGTGLGLSIVKGFAEALNGTVTAQNTPFGGALFLVKIPARSMTELNSSQEYPPSI